jgi:hypothetical protein
LAKAIEICVTGSIVAGGTSSGLLGVRFTSKYFLHDENSSTPISPIIDNIYFISDKFEIKVEF